MSTLSVPRIIDAAEVLHRNFTLDAAKNCFIVYFFAKRALKLWRHVRARGLCRSLGDLYAFIAQVSPHFFFPVFPPSIETFFFAPDNPSAHH
jgi:hypothetical protein